MARKSAKSIAVVVQIVLGIVLAAILGLLSGMLTGHPWFTNWVNASPRYSVWILAASLTAVVLAMIAVALWQHFTSKSDLDADATLARVDEQTQLLPGIVEQTVAIREEIVGSGVKNDRILEILQVKTAAAERRAEVAEEKAEIAEVRIRAQDAEIVRLRAENLRNGERIELALKVLHVPEDRR
ncbi:MAG: hypothetical protein ABSG10_06105 [Terracidiphilus sp.]